MLPKTSQPCPSKAPSNTSPSPQKDMRPSILQRPDRMTGSPSHTRLLPHPLQAHWQSPNRSPTAPRHARTHPSKTTDLPALTQPAKAKDTTAPIPKAHRYSPPSSSHTEAPTPGAIPPPRPRRPLPPPPLRAPPPRPRLPGSGVAQPGSRGAGGPRNAQPASGRRAPGRRVAPGE